MARRRRSLNDHRLVPGRRLPGGFWRGERTHFAGRVLTRYSFAPRFHGGNFIEVGGGLFGGDVLKFLLMRPTKWKPKSRFAATLPTNNTTTSENVASLGGH